MSSDLFQRNEVATVAGMAGTCGNAGLLIFSLLIGGLVTTIGYTPFFICLGVLDLVGALRAVDGGARDRGGSMTAQRISQSDPAAASIPIPPSSASATTTTSPRPPSSGSRACRFITRATWCTGGC